MFPKCWAVRAQHFEREMQKGKLLDAKMCFYMFSANLIRVKFDAEPCCVRV